MKGILLISHGEMAKGLANSATMFFGDEIEQFETACFMQEDNPDDYEVLLKEKIEAIDTGEGVIVLADLFGGTPTHKITTHMPNRNVLVITGMNFALLLELLTLRANGMEINKENLVNTGRVGIKVWDPFTEDIEEIERINAL